MHDKSINIGGSFTGVANTGDNSLVQNFSSSVENENVAEILAEVLLYLSQKYPDISTTQKETLFQIELQQKIHQDPKLRARLLSAVKAGGLELVKVLTNNPFVSVPLETVKGWFETGSD